MAIDTYDVRFGILYDNLFTIKYKKACVVFVFGFCVCVCRH